MQKKSNNISIWLFFIDGKWNDGNRQIQHGWIIHCKIGDAFIITSLNPTFSCCNIFHNICAHAIFLIVPLVYLILKMFDYYRNRRCNIVVSNNSRSLCLFFDVEQRKKSTKRPKTKKYTNDSNDFTLYTSDFLPKVFHFSLLSVSCVDVCIFLC